MQNPFATAQFEISCARSAQLPQDGRTEVAFAGRSNAGKSSALNAICAQKQLARVSKTPGRTQMINLFSVPLGRLADLPGYGYAEVPRAVRESWRRLVGKYVETRDALRGVVLIMDVRHPLMPFDQQMLAWVRHRGLPCHILLTKADKLGFGAAKTALLAVQRELGNATEPFVVQLFSAETGQGLDEARARIAKLMGAGARALARPSEE